MVEKGKFTSPLRANKYRYIETSPKPRKTSSSLPGRPQILHRCEESAPNACKEADRALHGEVAVRWHQVLRQRIFFSHT
jgi:hypothetical protein